MNKIRETQHSFRTNKFNFNIHTVHIIVTNTFMSRHSNVTFKN